MFKQFLAVIALVMLMSVPALAQNSDKVYINGIDANFPPFAYVGPDGKPTGFDVDAMNWIAAKMGFKVEHQPMEWSGIVASLKAKKIDMISSGLSVSEERAKQIDFSLPYWTIVQVVVVPKNSDLTAEAAMTTGLKVGVQAGTSDAKMMADSNGKDGRKYELVEYASSALAAQDVMNGRIDAAVMNDAPAAEAAAKLEVKIVGPAGIPDEVFAVGVNKEDPVTLEMINNGLTQLMADPYWQELIAKYKPGEVH
ncbi:ABC transporter substrate-binding protein [Deltaproteobacteria bacterium OttesenSCG-928-M10]|nr:ABC transporter substrate-binding protein [Deltaproteobacteria bacterium OttesenSCG-928-M10]